MDLPPNKLAHRKNSGYATAALNYAKSARLRSAKENDGKTVSCNSTGSASTSTTKRLGTKTTLVKARNTPPRKRAPNTAGNSGANSARKRKILATNFIEAVPQDANNVSSTSSRKSSFVDRHCMSFDTRGTGKKKASISSQGGTLDGRVRQSHGTSLYANRCSSKRYGNLPGKD